MKNQLTDSFNSSCSSSGPAISPRQQQRHEIIDEWLRLRKVAAHSQVLEVIDRELQILGYNVAAFREQQQQPRELEVVKQNGSAPKQLQHSDKDGSAGAAHRLTATKLGWGQVNQHPIKLSSGACSDVAEQRIHFLPLSSFAWDQQADFLKVYVKLAGVHNLPREFVSVDFTTQSLEVKVMNLNGKNYSFTQKRLSNPIDVERSTYRVKTDSVVLTLRKATQVWWSDLSYKEVKFAAPKIKKNGDTGSSILEIVKNLYEEGDDEMKRMIAKSWMQSHEERTFDGRSEMEGFDI